MTVTALVLGLLGFATTFAPDYVLASLGAPVSPATLLVTQVLGALYVGFAGLNWMARENLIGGIYGRPVAIGNLTHFLVASLAMIKVLTRAPELQILWPLALVYSALAASFGFILFRSPVRAPREE